ncbi:unnamed protein product [Brachionus calyciflorus]|uniref:C3H1-type domain-containing protein n=1 Tax=Brachionus calyciflorus TaxID=104777 RepID=A0A814GT21_9BILA|nr:unnamed protein product [Brachionus calyciflorus]
MFEFESEPISKNFSTNNKKIKNFNRAKNSPHKPINYGRYKTEMCRQFSENGECKYGDKCQFAHGINELKDVSRHPKYKTDFCKTFHSKGFCPYGPRCHFIHDINDKLELNSVGKKSDEIFSSLSSSAQSFEYTPQLPQSLMFNTISSSSSSSSSSQSPSPNSYLISSSRSSLLETDFDFTQFNPINSQTINQLNELISSLLTINLNSSVNQQNEPAPVTPVTCRVKNR